MKGGQRLPILTKERKENNRTSFMWSDLGVSAHSFGFIEKIERRVFLLSFDLQLSFIEKRRNE